LKFSLTLIDFISNKTIFVESKKYEVLCIIRNIALISTVSPIDNSYLSWGQVKNVWYGSGIPNMYYRLSWHPE